MIWLLLSLILAISLAYQRAGLRTTTAAFAALLLAYGVFGGSLAGFGLALLIFAGVFVPLSLPTLRQEWLTRPLLDLVQQRLLPTRSEQLFAPLTDTAWDRRLLGERAPDLLSGSVSSTEAASASLAVLTGNLKSAAQETLQALIRERAFAPSLTEDVGGLGLSATQVSQQLRQLASIDATSSLPGLIAHFDASAQLLQNHGSDEQRAALLPRLADGSLRLAIAAQPVWATGATLPDRALICRGLWKGKETTGLLAHFDKRSDSSAALANEFLVKLHLSDPEKLLGPDSIDGIVLARIPAQLADVQRQDGDSWIRVRSRDCFVPLDHLIGGPPAIGQGDVQWQSADTRLAANLAAAASGRATRRFEQLRLRSRIGRFHRLRSASSADLQNRLVETALDAYGLDTLRHQLARQLEQPPASPRLAAFAMLLMRRLDPASLSAGSQGEVALDPLIWALNPKLQQGLAAADVKPYGMALLKFDEAFWPAVAEVLAHQSHAGLLALSDGRVAGSLVGGRHAQRLARYRAALACCCDAHALDAKRESRLGLIDRALCEAIAHTLGFAAALHTHLENGQPRDQDALLEAYANRCAQHIETALHNFAQGQLRRRRRLWLRTLLLPLGPSGTTTITNLRSGAFLLTGPLSKILGPGPAADGSADARLESVLDAAGDAQARLLQALDGGRITPAEPLAQIGEALSLNLITADEADSLRSALNLSEDWLAAAGFDGPLDDQKPG